LLVGANIQKPLQLERERCPSKTNHDKNHPLFELPVTTTLQEKISCETKSIQVRSMMTTSTNMPTSSTNSTMLTQ
jgi:hypothetical protein